MKNYVVFGTNDTRRFIEKLWLPVAEVKAKSKVQALKEFRDHCHRHNDCVHTLHPNYDCFVSYRVKII